MKERQQRRCGQRKTFLRESVKWTATSQAASGAACVSDSNRNSPARRASTIKSMSTRLSVQQGALPRIRAGRKPGRLWDGVWAPTHCRKHHNRMPALVRTGQRGAFFAKETPRAGREEARLRRLCNELTAWPNGARTAFGARALWSNSSHPWRAASSTSATNSSKVRSSVGSASSNSSPTY